MDRRGVQFLHHCDSSRTGLRFVAHYWIDEKRGEAQLVRGDGRTDSFRIYDEQEFTDVTEAEFCLAVERWMTGTIAEVEVGGSGSHR